MSIKCSDINFFFSLRYYVKVNTLNIPPGEYVRKNET